ncbi:MAG TPA: tetratricopeptide repeat protein [Thermoanaerobaculia bacterium]|nr:tetratricopeptide repeat protein [Thermoanaerobaculia bacterium]
MHRHRRLLLAVVGILVAALPLPAQEGQIEEEEMGEEQGEPIRETQTFLVDPDDGDPPEEAPDATTIPTHPVELAALAQQKYLEGELEVASQLYQRLAEAVEEPAVKAEHLMTAAWLENQLFRPWVAKELIGQALAQQLDYPFAAENYSQEFVDLYQQALDQARSQRRNRAGDLVRVALQDIASDDFARARLRLQEALELAPADPFALYNLALVEVRSGRAEEAIAGFERLLAIEAANPGSLTLELRAQSFANLGLLYYEREYLEDARRHLRQSLDLDPASARTWNNLGLTLRRLGEEGAAEEAFRRAIGLAPEDVQIANNLAATYLGAGKHAEAAAVLRQVTARAPDDAATWLNLALAQRGGGELDAAAASLERVLERDTTNRLGLADRAATYLAMVRFEQGLHQQAIAAADRALVLAPGSAEALIYQGLSRQASGDLQGARQSLERAVALDPGRPEVHNNLGTVLVELREYAAAEEAFRRALAIRPGFPEAAGNLQQVVAHQQALAEQSTMRGTPAPTDRRRRDFQPKSLGVHFDPNDYTYLGIRGAVVETVMGDSPASKAGLRKGDVVLGVDGRKLDGPQDLFNYIQRQKPRQIVLDILREGTPRRLTVDLD